MIEIDSWPVVSYLLLAPLPHSRLRWRVRPALVLACVVDAAVLHWQAHPPNPRYCRDSEKWERSPLDRPRVVAWEASACAGKFTQVHLQSFFLSVPDRCLHSSESTGTSFGSVRCKRKTGTIRQNGHLSTKVAEITTLQLLLLLLQNSYSSWLNLA